MHTIKLDVEDNIYNTLMNFLQNLKGLTIKEDKKTVSKSNEIDFSKYKIESFKSIKNPENWQKELRDEWE
jgi:hypothetical protein